MKKKKNFLASVVAIAGLAMLVVPNLVMAQQPGISKTIFTPGPTSVTVRATDRQIDTARAG